MFGTMEAVIVFLVVVALLAIAGTIVAVLRDGRGHMPPEPSHRPWSADELPSSPYVSRSF
ncbi:hypothetical protein GU243_19240 [Pseudarthrobacter psychrotolerans]|uniref:Uncharacterized protein n=1 Tax=Pseudarthrobacter psychrotolerans TaxID=2697569 RepID=A0A6P1NRS8_9MICC|nr:hypothetical protein [Pseudarthrobacter psychrotolerans]QHK21477.1 hypothetical protein GU243_19240 [Pseudarthrobacter psychrotolerans]